MVTITRRVINFYQNEQVQPKWNMPLLYIKVHITQLGVSSKNELEISRSKKEKKEDLEI